ncbi:MAG TPA: c-type cytochrome [Pirellulaceae bacterium]|nr:c-type cytochrome [Pirellulaceae bacterium]
MMRMQPRLTITLSFLLLALCAGCDLPGQPNVADRPVPPHEVHDFDQLYQRNCAGCHGREGKLGPAPPLNDPLFLTIIPDTELQSIVRDGRHGTSMPAFALEHGGALTDEQAEIIATGLKRTWLTTASDNHSMQHPAYVGATGDERSGATVFASACATCHGKDGRGTEMTGAINQVAFLSLISDQALRRIIITGRPDLGMPSYHKKDGRGDNFQPLSSTEIDDLVALLASWRQAGSTRTTAASAPPPP